jgi:predicted Zn finger-like uncharacterized protein
MPFRASCTGCQATFNVPDEMAGKRVRCPSCKQVFQVPDAPPVLGPASAEENIPEVVLSEPRDTGDRLQDGPSNRSSRRDEPRSRRRAEDSDDRDDRRRRREGSSSVLPWVILGGVAVLILAIGGGVLALLMMRSDDAPVAAQGNRPNRDKMRDDFPFPPPGQGNPGKPRPPIEPFPPIDPPVDPPMPPVVVKNDPIEVPPALAMEPCRPPALKGPRTELQLAGTVTDVCVGGAGRFLLLTLAGERKLAIFDANEGKVVKYLTLGDGDKVAAGLDRFVIVAGTGENVQRWSLATFEREQTVPLVVPGAIKAVCMGSASLGPVVILSDERFFDKARYLSLATLQPVEITTRRDRLPNGPQNHFLHASPDGRIYTSRPSIGGEPHDMFSVVLNNRQATIHELHGAGGSIFMPSADGRFVYAESGIYNPEMRLVYPDKEIRNGYGPFMPAHQGPYFLRIEGATPLPSDRRPATGAVSVYLPESRDQPLVTVPQVDGYVGGGIPYGKPSDKLMNDRRIHLIPEAKLLVSLPQTNDRLILRAVDLDKELEASKIDYLFVASRPPLSFALGAEFRYQASVKSKKGDVKYNLEAAPTGMTVSPTGLVQWMVPADFADKRVDATLKITDAGGKETFQNLKLTVEVK